MDNNNLQQHKDVGTEQKSAAKLSYQTPELSTLGSVAELTLGVGTPGIDAASVSA